MGTTAETLRHYDRIGLVTPCKTDEWTGYRYYSEAEIVRLNTVRALKCMDMPLAEIKRLLSLDDIGEIERLLRRAEESANRKIEELNDVKARIKRALAYYGAKGGAKEDGVFLRAFPERVILLSDRLTAPSLENLWDYHRHYYAQVGEDKERFSFEDAAGVYEEAGVCAMFTVCERYGETAGLKTLPAGKYLCAACTEETKEDVLRALCFKAEERYGVAPRFSLRFVTISGILQWNYQLQVYIGEE